MKRRRHRRSSSARKEYSSDREPGSVSRNPSLAREQINGGAVDVMCKALSIFGPEETLQLLVRYAGRDEIVNHLLLLFPSLAAVSDFYSRMPVYVHRRTFESLPK